MGYDRLPFGLRLAVRRSHCIFTIHLDMRSRVESSGTTLCGKLHLVDLAGSERVSKTQSEGTLLREAMCLRAPSRVLRALGRQCCAASPPYSMQTAGYPFRN